MGHPHQVQHHRRLGLFDSAPGQWQTLDTTVNGLGAAKMSRRFMSINLAKPIETVEQFPFVLCAWPSFADQPYINNYRIYDDRVGETTRFTYRPDHEWYWFPRQKPTEVSMLKCYDSVTDGSVSRWVFPYGLYRPERAPRRSMPQERRRPVLCVLLKDGEG